jgi:ketosteroid isomerase-like protein
MSRNPAAAAVSALSLAAIAAAPALAQTEPTPTEIVQRHMQFAAAGDVDSMVGDYADDAVVLTAGSAVQGKAAIRTVFATMLKNPAARTGMKPTKIWSEGDVGFVTWEQNAGTPTAVKGGDSFVVHHSMIVVQAVFIGARPPA